MKKISHKGFTLIELSIVILIISMFGAVALNFLGNKGTADKYRETRKKIIRISEAIKIYKSDPSHAYIPCPASNTALVTASDFGVGDCTSGGVVALAGGKNVYSGSIPIVDLGLTPEYMFDAWGNRLVYVMDQDIILDSSANSTTTDGTAPKINILVTDETGSNYMLSRQPLNSTTLRETKYTTNASHTVKDCVGNDRIVGVVSTPSGLTYYQSDYADTNINTGTSNRIIECAAFVLISRGQNGLWAYDSRGTQKTTSYGSSGLGEQANETDTGSDYTFMDTQFNTDTKTTSGTSYFDDIIVYRTKTWLDSTN